MHIQKRKLSEGTSGYSRAYPYQHYKSLFLLAEGDDEIISVNNHIEECNDNDYEELLNMEKKLKEGCACLNSVGSMQTPRSQRLQAKKQQEEKEDIAELDEEMVHPDDKIGNAMLKKMKVPQPFKSNKKGEVHQKK